MKIWLTEFRAIKFKTGEMKTYAGQEVIAPTSLLAQQWCDENNSCLRVIGELVAEISCKPGTHDPDMSNMDDYENIQLN